MEFICTAGILAFQTGEKSTGMCRAWIPVVPFQGASLPKGNLFLPVRNIEIPAVMNVAMVPTGRGQNRYTIHSPLRFTYPGACKSSASRPLGAQLPLSSARWTYLSLPLLSTLSAVPISIRIATDPQLHASTHWALPFGSTLSRSEQQDDPYHRRSDELAAPTPRA